jgi:NADH-quinone oxidoreductase subunit L
MQSLASALAVALGAAGILTAYLVYSAKVVRAPRPWALLQEKFYFDRAYDAVFYRPAVALAKALYVVVEWPLSSGSIAGVGAGFRELGGLARSLQTGLVRTYALAIAASLALITLVFIAVR